MKIKHLVLSVLFQLFLVIDASAGINNYVLTVDSPTVIETIGTFPLNIRVEPKLSPGDIITISYHTVSGTATSGLDFQALSQTNVIINSSYNSAQSTDFNVNVEINDDNLAEGDESFSFVITSATVNNGNTVSVNSASGGLITIEDDEAIATATVSVNDISVNEAAGTASFTVSLSEPVGNTVTFSYVTADGTALQGQDYTLGSGTGTINANALSTTIPVSIINDTISGETGEYFYVYLSNVANASEGDVEGKATIIDDDTIPSISMNNASIAEQDVDTTAHVNIIMSEGSLTDFNVTIETVDNSAVAGSDYVAIASTIVTIPAGVTTYPLDVTIIGDDVIESIENFSIKITNVTGATYSGGDFVLAGDTSTITIFDDDSPNACSSFVGLMSINEYQNNPHYFDAAGNKIVGNYVEIKYIDLLVKQYVNDNWSVSVYTTSGSQGILWSGKDPSCIDPRYEVFQFDNSVMAAQGYVVLADDNGNEVDVLNIDGSDHYSQQCQDFVYDTTFDASAQNKDLFRDPDGTGDWYDTGAGANSLGSRCVDLGGSSGPNLQFTIFDAIDSDESFTGPVVSDGSATPIKTKLTNTPFTVDILAIDTNGQLDPVDSTLEVKVYLGDAIGTKLTATGVSAIFNTGDTRVSLPLDAFDYNGAIQQARILVEYCSDGNVSTETWDNCFVTNIDPSRQVVTSSRNKFAIRPTRFNIAGANSTPIKAMDPTPTNLIFSAYDGLSAPTSGYNEMQDYNVNGVVQNGSFTIEMISTVNCLPAAIPPTITPPVTFADGTTNGDYQFDQVGVFTLTLSENIGNEFAVVDADDTPLTMREILQAEENITIIPDRFELSVNYRDASDNNFTYLSDGTASTAGAEFNMMSMLDINLTAVDYDGVTMQNYRDGCFARDVNVSVNHGPAASELTTIVTRLEPKFGNELPVDNNFSVGDPITYDENTLNGALPSKYFLNGVADVRMLINFNRKTNQAVNPFTFTLDDITVTDQNGTTQGAAPQVIDEDALFVYGRVHAPRNRAMCDAGSCEGHVTYNYEIYGDNAASNALLTPLLGANKSKSVDSVNWYKNTEHNTTSDGKINSVTVVAPVSAAVSTPLDGATSTATFTYTGSKGYPYKATATITADTDVERWLVYDKYLIHPATQMQSSVEYYGPGKWTTTGDNPTHTTGGVTKSKKNTNRRIRW